MAKKPLSNPLFSGGSTNFSVADSFGITATLSPAPIANAEEDSFVGGGSSSLAPGPPMLGASPLQPPTSPMNATPSMFSTPMSFFRSSPAPGDSDPFGQIGGTTPAVEQVNTSPQSVSLSAPTEHNSPPIQLKTPIPPVPQLQTPVPGVAPPTLTVQGATPLPVSPGPPGAPMFMPPPVATATPMSSSTIKRPTYAPTPFLGNGAASPSGAVPTSSKLASIPGLPPLPEPKTVNYMPSGPPPVNNFIPPTTPHLPPSQSTPNLSSMSNMSQSSNYSYPGVTTQEVTSHWFYRVGAVQDLWKPFSMEDSLAIDMANDCNKKSEPIPVNGTRYDVYIDRRQKVPAYWPGKAHEIRRCSWFHRRDPEGRWIPYDEQTAEKLEKEYQAAASSGRWQVKVVFDSGEWVMLHSAEVMMHFPTSSTSHGALDDWGQVQPQTDPSLRPQVVHRGLDGLPDIPDGETTEVDHVFFVVHGIGAACDMKFRPLEEVVDGFRDLASDLSEKHFAGAHLASRANRVEFLPVHWHDKLHGEDAGTDARIQPLTLRSIPKLRSFVNDTLLDVLFYTSPLYCQTILDTVCGEINKIYKLFTARNPGFKGDCSVIGHSLGSLILFDLLSGQKREDDQKDESEPESSEQDFKPRWEKDLGIEDVFSKLEISEHLTTFTDQGIGLAELETCTEDDLKEAGLPLGPRKRLLTYLTGRSKRRSGFDEFQASSVARQVSYNVGPAGTGQPSVKYPTLDIKPVAFFALGSPIGMFLAVRGIDTLGMDFKFPTCKMFFNIFHPYDPVAYRIETLVNRDLAELRPYLVPHHMGRKRMHLELKETMSRVGNDIKQRVMDSLKATLGAVYSVAGTITGQVEEAVESELAHQHQQEERSESPVQEVSLESQLNGGRRIDFVLQEAPLESFNEYVFAVTSHLCYWESEDTTLMIIKEVYSTMDIFADNELPQNKLYNPSIPGPVEAAYPQYSAPPVIPQPSMPRTASVPVNLTNMTSMNNMSMTGSQPPSVPGLSGVIPSVQINSPPAPPPSFFNVNSLPGDVPPHVKPGGISYPRPVTMGQPTGPMGMDPTAPISSGRPVGPPPIGGFMR